MTSPILAYELERAGNAKRWFALRVGYMAVFLGVEMVGLLIASASVSPTYPAGAAFSGLGRALFQIFTISIGAAVVLFTPGYASGMIAVEKERKTLGLLLVTPLTGREIIQHKALSQSLVLASTLLAPLPLVFVSLVFGGVEWREVVGRFSLISATFVFCFGAGALASAVSPDTRAAGRLARGVAWFFILAPPAALAVANLVLRSAGPGTHLATCAGRFDSRMWAASPFFNPPMAAIALGKSIEARVPGTVPGGGGWVYCCLLEVLLAWLCVRGAGVALLDRAAVLDTVGRRWAIFPGGVRYRRGRRTKEVWDNPVLWREAQTGRTVQWVLWLALGMAAFFALMTFAAVRVTDAWYHWIAIVVETLVLFGRVIDAGATAFAGEREKGTLDLVLLTELSPPQIFWGKLAGVVRGTIFFWVLPLFHGLLAWFLGIFPAGAVVWVGLNTVVYGAFFLVATLTISAKSDTRRSAGRRTLLMLAGILVSPITAIFFGPLALVLSPTVWVGGALQWSEGKADTWLYVLGHTASLVLYTLITMGAARSLWGEIEQGLAPSGWPMSETSAPEEGPWRG